MIRYPINKKSLKAMIRAQNPTWLDRAATRTDEFRRKGRYKEKSSIWSEVKPVYMRLQGPGKCAYCEREMEPLKFGKVEQDVEHFRPKGNIRSWRLPESLKQAGVKVTAPAAAGKGYHLLPYHVFNYAAACKPCNSVLKKDYFPISGIYDLSADDPATLAAEQAYLVYPIGDIDEDPEKLIEFYGTSPRPVAAGGMKRLRALVTIEFFKLDDPDGRKGLYRDRAILIMALYPLLERTKIGATAARKTARESVNKFLTPKLRHLNCARSFERLFKSDSAEARAVYDAAVKLVTSIS